MAVVGPDNKVKIQNMQVGSQVGADWIVTQGVNAGDRVIVGGMQYARPGATVTPVPAPVTRTPPAGGR